MIGALFKQYWQDVKAMDRLSMLVVLAMPVVTLADSVNGALLRSGLVSPVSLSQLIKIGLLLGMLVQIARKDIKVLLVLVLFMCSVFLLVVGHQFTVIGADLRADIEMMLKLLLAPVAVAFFSLLINRRQITPPSIVFIALVNAMVVAANVLAGMLGFGYSSYQGNIGKIGYFYAGNEVSVLLVILTSVILFWAWQQNKGSYYLLSLFLLGVCVLTTTKASILGTVLLIFSIPFINDRHRLLKVTTPKLIAGSFAVVLFTGSMLGARRLLEVSGLWDRWVYWYARYDHSMLSIVLSGRDRSLARAAKLNDHFWNGWDQLIGVGEGHFIDMMGIYGKDAIIEMDWFDTFYFFGALGLVLIGSFYLFILMLNLRHFFDDRYQYAPILLILFIVLMSISFLSGHVLYSGMGGLYIGMIFALSVYKKPLVEEA